MKDKKLMKGSKKDVKTRGRVHLSGLEDLADVNIDLSLMRNLEVILIGRNDHGSHIIDVYEDFPAVRPFRDAKGEPVVVLTPFYFTSITRSHGAIICESNGLETQYKYVDLGSWLGSDVNGIMIGTGNKEPIDEKDLVLLNSIEALELKEKLLESIEFYLFFSSFSFSSTISTSASSISSPSFFSCLGVSC